MSILQQGLHFEVIFTFNLDKLRRSSGGASRGVLLLQLRHIEDLVDLLEPALEVKSVCRLSYVLYHPEWSPKPCPKLPNTYKMESLQRQ